MPDQQCPVCKSDVPPVEGDATECGSCGAKLERLEGQTWTLAGDAPAG